jgi:hypothetical protein
MVKTRLVPAKTFAVAEGRFEILKRIGVARITPSLVKDIDAVLAELVRGEADNATRRWFAARGDDDIPSDELADVTLAHYERALRKFRPTYELDYVKDGAARTCRYRGAYAFLAWTARQRRARSRILKVTFVSPDCRFMMRFEPGIFSGRSYLWANGADGDALERLVAALEAAVKKTAGKGARFRSWHFGVACAGAGSLAFAVGVLLKLKGLPWPGGLGAAVVAHAACSLALIALFSRAWPRTTFELYDADVSGRVIRTAARAGFLALYAAAVGFGLWAVVTSLFRLVW